MSSSHKVLVIEESPSLRAKMRELLEDAGYVVRTVPDPLEAVDAIEDFDPSIVLCEVDMSVMTSLDLVEEFRSRFPSTPVVLTTGGGGEGIAGEALRLGAASYVPKAELAELLCETVAQVLALADARPESFPEPACAVVRSEIHFRIENDESLVPELIARMEQVLAGLSFCNELHWMQIAMALDEAILNSIFHGNLDVSSELRQSDDGKPFFEMVNLRKTLSPYRERSVYISLVASPERATFKIRDEGNGFDITKIPDPTDPANLERAGGRGLLLIQSFMDEVRHNPSGNEITMVKLKPDPNAVSDDDDDDDDYEDED